MHWIEDSNAESESFSTSVWKVAVNEVREKLKDMELSKRKKFAIEHKLCFNCLKAGHTARQC